jgi:CBS domain-containing protein
MDRLDAPVRDVMTTPVKVIDGELALVDAARILWDQRIGSLLVSDVSGEGILTESDVVRGVRDGVDPGTIAARELMTTPVITVPADEPVATAVERMNDNDVKRVPAVEDGSFVGIVTTTDVARLVAPDLDTVIEAFADA